MLGGLHPPFAVPLHECLQSWVVQADLEDNFNAVRMQLLDHMLQLL